MSSETCPGCGRSEKNCMNKLYLFPRIGGTQTRTDSGLKKCTFCNLIIPTDKTLKIWNGKEAVEVDM